MSSSASSGKLKAIPTEWNGYLFRSRMEARWAVFFDFLGMPYEYEKEGYDLGGIYYLPDFWLPEQDAYFEVKGLPTPVSEKKVRLLCEESQKDVYIATTTPKWDNKARWNQDHLLRLELCTPSAECGSVLEGEPNYGISYCFTCKKYYFCYADTNGQPCEHSACFRYTKIGEACSQSQRERFGT